MTTKKGVVQGEFSVELRLGHKVMIIVTIASTFIGNRAVKTYDTTIFTARKRIVLLVVDKTFTFNMID